MEISIADQIALDDALVAPANRLKIGKCNLRLSSDVTSKEATLQVAYDVLKLTPFYKAFQVSADVPEIYMQEFWASAYVHNRSVRFKMNNKKHILVLINSGHSQICPKVSVIEKNIPPKTKGSKKKANTDTITKQKPPTAPTEKKSGKVKLKTIELETISEADLTKADISWKSSDDDQDDEQAQDEEDADKNDTESTRWLNDFVHPKLTTHDDDIIHEEETDEDDSFDPTIHNASRIISSMTTIVTMKMKEQCIEGAKSDKSYLITEDQEMSSQYTNTDLDGRDDVMTDVILPQVQATQEIKDTHVTLTLVNPDGQQQSSSVSSGFPSWSRPSLHKSIALQHQETTSRNSTHKSISISALLYSLPVDQYLANKKQKQWTVAVQYEVYRIREESSTANQQFLESIDEGMKKIIKDQVKKEVSKLTPKIEKLVTDQLESEVLVRSSKEGQQIFMLYKWQVRPIKRPREGADDEQEPLPQNRPGVQKKKGQEKNPGSTSAPIRKDDDVQYTSKKATSQTKIQDIEEAASSRAVEDLQLGSAIYLERRSTALNDRLKGIRIEYLPQTFWSQRDKANARAMIQAIDKRLKIRRIMRRLEDIVELRVIHSQMKKKSQLEPTSKRAQVGPEVASTQVGKVTRWSRDCAWLYPPEAQDHNVKIQVQEQAQSKKYESSDRGLLFLGAHAQSEEVQELLSKLLQDLQSINEELAEYITTPSWNLPTSSYDDNDDEYSFATQEYLMTCECDLPVCDDSSPKKDEVLDDIIAILPRNGNDHFNAKSSPSKSMLNRDNVISSPKIDLLIEEFSGELALLALIPPGNVEA
ncbi:hypothetical protein Tco_0849408, partial [Tanacetum coccineum]